MDLNTLGCLRRRLASEYIAAGQHPRGIAQHGAQLAKDTVRGAHDTDHGIGREHQRVDRERNPTTDQNIEQPHLRRRGQRRDEDRRHGGLAYQQLSSSEDDRDQHRQHHQQSNLREPSSDRPHQQVGEHDAQHHPRDQLHRSLSALPERRAQRDHGRDRRERRPMLDPQQHRAIPRPDRGHAGLQNRPQMAMHPSTSQWDKPLHA